MAIHQTDDDKNGTQYKNGFQQHFPVFFTTKLWKIIARCEEKNNENETENKFTFYLKKFLHNLYVQLNIVYK